MAEPAEPMTIVAVYTHGFRRAFAELRQALGIKNEIITANGDKLVLTVNGEGVGVSTVVLPWSIVGPPRVTTMEHERWGRGMVRDFLGMIFQIGPSAGSWFDRQAHPVLRLPVTVGDQHFELPISVDSDWGIAREVEQRRPRPAYPSAKPWA